MLQNPARERDDLFKIQQHRERGLTQNPARQREDLLKIQQERERWRRAERERERERERECVCVCVHADVEEEEECMKTRLACRVETAPIRASFKLTLSFTIKLEL